MTTQLDDRRIDFLRKILAERGFTPQYVLPDSLKAVRQVKFENGLDIMIWIEVRKLADVNWSGASLLLASEARVFGEALLSASQLANFLHSTIQQWAEADARFPHRTPEPVKP